MRDPREVCEAAGATRRWSVENHRKTMNACIFGYYVV